MPHHHHPRTPPQRHEILLHRAPSLTTLPPQGASLHENAVDWRAGMWLGACDRLLWLPGVAAHFHLVLDRRAKIMVFASCLKGVV